MLNSKNHRFYITFVGILLLSLAKPALGQVDPAIVWKKMKLPHFDLIYDADHQELANIYGIRLEAAYEKLTPLFPPGPQRTAVVIDDRTDLTNGSASVFPYPTIMVYPVLPTPQDSIGEFNDWASELVTHEFTHILAMNPQRDNVQFLSQIFGSFMSPNILLPRWWHEGLAVEMETRFSTAGRLRSAQQDAWLRSYWIDNQWDQIQISDANEVTIPTWPYGARPYILGAAFWSELMDLKGPKIANDLTWAHAGRLPYLINTPAENLTGQNYPRLFEVMKTNLYERVSRQILELKAASPTPIEKLNLNGLEVYSPSLSPDGLKMVVSYKDPESGRRGVIVQTRPTLEVQFESAKWKELLESNPGEVFVEMKTPVPHTQEEGEDGPRSAYITRVSWFPDSKRVVFDSVDKLNWYHKPSDLYVYNFEKKETTRLSHNLRAREPVVSPDGKTITFVKVLPGKTELANFDIETQKQTATIISGPLQSRCSHPTYWDAHTLIFSYREHGQEVLQAYDLDSHKTRVLFADHPNANFPTVTQGHLLFTSTLNGVHNLYVSKDLLTAKPVTHTLTAVYQSTFDWAKKDYYLTEQTTQGLQLGRVNDQVTQQTPNTLPKVPTLFSDRYPSSSSLELPAATSAPAAVEEYSSTEYLVPRYWIPFFSWDSFSSYLSASTSAEDPLSKQAWNATGIFDLGFGHSSYELSYLNTQTITQMLVSLNDVTVVLPGAVPDRDVFQSVQANWEVTAISPYMTAGLGWNYMSRIVPPVINNQSGPSLQMMYSDFVQAGAQISPESGYGGTLTLTSFLPGPSLVSFNQAELSLVAYWSKFLPKRHALMTKFQSFMMDQYVPTNYAFTYSQTPMANSSLPFFLMRAYPSGTFQGRVLNNLNVEYRFPLKPFYFGNGTTPVYYKQLHAAFVADGVSADGIAYNFNIQNYQAVPLSQSFWSLGAELRIDTTIGYALPITFYAGVYMPSNLTLTNGGNYAFGLYL